MKTNTTRLANNSLRHAVSLRLLATLFVLAATPLVHAAINVTVTTTAASGAGSLTQAITDTNANGGGTISFNIPGGGLRTISGVLPAITQPVTIDGYSQPGTSVNTADNTDNAVLLIELAGCNLTLKTGGCRIAGLIIRGDSGTGILVTIANASAPKTGNVIAGNFIGTTQNGMAKASAPLINAGVRIDATTQTTGNVIGGTALKDRNIISGVTNNGIEIYGTSNQVLGNFIGTNAAGNAAIPNGNAGILVAGADQSGVGGANDTRIGGTAPGSRNVISGNNGGGGILRISVFDPPTTLPTVVQGNYIGTDSTGTTALPNRGGISGPSFIIGGTTLAARNIISGNLNVGIQTFSSTVQGNFIGTDVTGTKALPNTFFGVSIGGTTLVGGTTAGSGNLISGNNIGVNIGPNSTSGGATANRSGSVVQGNLIGTDVSGLNPLPNTGVGVRIGGDSTSPFVNRATVGGSAAGAGNTIAFNGLGGVFVTLIGPGGSAAPPESTSHAILSNSIHDNGGLGIDLNSDGVTPNDPQDPDKGPSGLQNFPVLSYANSASGTTTVAGNLNSTPSTQFLIEFFSSPAADSSGSGEGATLIGSVNVTTDSNGDAPLSASLTVNVLSGQFITATATANPTTTGATTSEFSNAVLVNGSPLVNISTRMSVLTANNVLIAGFIITGSEPKKLILRAIGPSIPVGGTLADPTLELYNNANQLIGENDNWRSTHIGGVITADQAAEIGSSGLAPTNDLEAAMIVNLPSTSAGTAYTAIVRGAADGTGIGLVELYDLSRGASARLANISTRGFVRLGDDVMIAGLIVGTPSATVVLRAIGPSLIPFGITNALPDPTMELHDGNGNTIAVNDNWQESDQAAAIQASGLAPSNNLESALLKALPAGPYTAIVRGNNNGTGVGLVEAYSLP